MKTSKEIAGHSFVSPEIKDPIILEFPDRTKTRSLDSRVHKDNMVPQVAPEKPAGLPGHFTPISDVVVFFEGKTYPLLEAPSEAFDTEGHPQNRD